MIVTDCKTDTFLLLKSTVWCDHDYGRRFHRVLFWKLKQPMVVAPFERGLFKTEEAVVPSKDVFRIGLCHEVEVRLRLLQVFVFFSEAFDSEDVRHINFNRYRGGSKY